MNGSAVSGFNARVDVVAFTSALGVGGRTRMLDTLVKNWPNVLAEDELAPTATIATAHVASKRVTRNVLFLRVALELEREGEDGRREINLMDTPETKVIDSVCD